MDFTKVQRLRDSERKKRQLKQAVTVIFTVVMVLTVIPKVQTYQMKKITAVSADSFMKYVSEEKLREAYEIGFTQGLKKQHPFAVFDKNIHNLFLHKGGVVDFKAVDFVSHPNGKPYELLSYRIYHDRGFSRIDLAMEPVDNRHLIRAYRITAAGL